jgi:hypothetical protein
MRLKIYALAAALAAGFATYTVWNSALTQGTEPAVAQIAQEARPAIVQEAKPAPTEVAQQEAKPAPTEVAQQEAKPAPTEVAQQEAKPAPTEVAQQEAKPANTQVAQQEAKPANTEVAQQEAKPAVAQEPKPAQIDRNGVMILIRSSLIALDQANKTGNYTVLRDLGAPNFQATNTAARLGDIFAALRRDKVDLSGVAALDPQLTLLPQIEPNGLMHMIGFFPSVPAQVKFELAYAPVDGQWKLFGISVGLGQSGPAAPAPVAAAPQAAAPAAAPAAVAKKPKLKNKDEQQQ